MFAARGRRHNLLAEAGASRHTLGRTPDSRVENLRLTLESGPRAGTAVTLDREHPVHLGSAPSCELQLAGAEPQHAVIKALKDHGFGIKALAPGLFVNGDEIEAAALRDGDLIELAGHKLVVGSREIRQQIAGFKILGELGRGGMGIVYRAEQVSLRREVALKVLTHQLTQDQSFVQKFVAEARAAARLSHPNVVQVFDVDHDGETFYYAMEVMHEGSLEGWLKQHGRMPVEQALQVIADAAAGLAYAESLGIVHRDIKPDNLMLDQHGTVKIADLGLAHSEEQDDGKLHGTPHFMAPEQVLRKGADHRTDLYALGCTFYRLVTGRTPFKGATVKDILRAQVKDEAEPANKVESSVPNEVAAIIHKLMAKEPTERYQSANELVLAVQTLLHPPHRKGLWIALSAAAVLVAGGAIYWAVNKPNEIKTIRERITDPVAQQLYDDNEQLKVELQQKNGRIALLEARLSGKSGTPLTVLLDQVVRDHADTPAAVEAKALAAQVRREVAAAEAAAAARRQHAEAAAKALSDDLDNAFAAGDFAAALQRLAAPVDAEVQQEPGWQEAQKAQEQRLRRTVAERLAELHRKVAAAREGTDPEALAAALPPLFAALDDKTGWPAALVPDRSAERDFAAASQQAVTDLQQQRTAAQWQDYEQMLRQSLRPQLAAHDFAGAVTSARALAERFGEQETGQRAARLCAALQLATQAAADFATAAASGSVQMTTDEGLLLQVTRIDWQAGTLGVVEKEKRSAKEQPLPFADVSPEQWSALLQTVADPAGRQCLLGFLCLDGEVRAARRYLGNLTANDDDSGTGANGYGLSDAVPEGLLRGLPDTTDKPWALGLRAELAAGRLLGAGLRALSERRNLAAQSHLERLLKDHAHSFVAAALSTAP